MIKEEISFLYEKDELKFSLAEEEYQSWIRKAIMEEGKKPGSLSYFFCCDSYLLNVNQHYLNHDTYTDIITFDYVSGNLISGDILISVERVRENAEKFQVPFEQEMKRVMIHGILHLLGYTDQNPQEQTVMRKKEDYFLTLHPSK